MQLLLQGNQNNNKHQEVLTLMNKSLPLMLGINSVLPYLLMTIYCIFMQNIS